MQSGKLDRQITLRHRVLTRNDHGEEIVSYADYATVWAKKSDLRAREFFAAQQVNSDLTTEFTIRHRSDVLFTDRIYDGSMSYNIGQIVEIPRKRGLTMIASAVPP